MQHNRRLNCILAPWFVSCRCLLQKSIQTCDFRTCPELRSTFWTHFLLNRLRVVHMYLKIIEYLFSAEVHSVRHFCFILNERVHTLYRTKFKPWLLSKLCIVVTKTRQAPERIHMLKPHVDTALESFQWHDKEFVILPPVTSEQRICQIFIL